MSKKRIDEEIVPERQLKYFEYSCFGSSYPTDTGTDTDTSNTKEIDNEHKI